MRIKLVSAILTLGLALASCSDRRTVIGVSQCSDDTWRQKVNREIKIGQYQYKDVDVRFCSANNDAKRQVRQIDSLVASGVDLLIVAPSDANTVTPAVERAYKKGIPVILYDRKIDSDCYTAYVGADNVEIGRVVARFIAAKLGGKGRVLEIAGLKGSTPVEERHRGFVEEISKYPGITTSTINGDWNVDGARKIMSRSLAVDPNIQCVFGHNDAEALGAWEAAKAVGKERGIMFVGIDGLPGKRQGIDLVKRGCFAASYIYPTHGETLVPLAMRILNNKPIERMNYLPSSLVTAENAAIVEMQNNEIASQANSLDAIYANIDSYMKMYRSQKIISWLAAFIVLLLIVLAAYNYYVYKTKAKVGRRLRQIADEKVAFFTKASHQLRTPLTLVAGPLRQLMSQGGFNDKQQGMLDIIQRNVAELEHLTSNVLNFQTRVDSATDNTDQRQLPTVSDETVSQLVLQDSRRDIVTKNDPDDDLDTILIVDDNADIRSYLRSLLSASYYVIEASDGRNGLRLARESVPDLIVSDVMMPIMNGLEFCSKIKADDVTCHIPVILLTARSAESQRIEGYEHGADAYITKPFNADLLLTRIESMLANRRKIKLAQADGKAEAPETADTNSVDNLFISRFREAAMQHLGDADLKMDDLGSELRLSRVQLYRKIKALTGKSPTDIIREMRLNRGHYLLCHTDRPISEIAYEVGFAVPSYFTTCFKKQYGINPTELRRG